MIHTKRFVCALALCATILSVRGFAADPTFTLLRETMIGSYGSLPTGISAKGNTLYTVTFNDRRVLKLINVDSDATTVTILAHTASDDIMVAGPVTWPVSRGLTGCYTDETTNTILVAGDQGIDGAIFSFSPTGDLLIKDAAAIGGSNHRYGAAARWGGNILASQTGNGLFCLLPTLAGFTGGSYLSSSQGAKSYMRDIVQDGNDFYVSFTNSTTESTDGVVKFTGGTPGSFSGYTGTVWASTTGKSTGAAMGVGIFNYASGGKKYLMVPDRTAKTLDFYDLATATKLTSLGTSTGIYDPYDAVAIGNLIFVTQYNSSTTPTSRITVIGVDVPSAVTDWQLLN